MPIGSSNGQVYEDESSMALGIPLEASTEPAGALKSESGTTLPATTNASPGAPQKVYITGKENTGELPGSSFSPPSGPDPAKGQQGFMDRLLGLNGPRYQTWPEQLVRGAIDAIQAPGEAAQGNLPMWAQDPETGEVHTSPQVIEKANQLADLAVLGPTPVAKAMADGTLGSFAGVRSMTANKTKLSDAQQLFADGMHPDDVFRQTGWFQGADNRWRYEIPDDKAVFNPPGDTGFSRLLPLPKVLDHPELYKAYPFLKNATVLVDKSLGDGASMRGIHDMTIGPKATKQTILHEAQHAIQEWEGFAKGGAPASDSRLNYYKTIEPLQDEWYDLAIKHNKEGANSLTPDEQSRLDYLTKIMKLEDARQQAGVKEAYRNYLRLAGEVESRNVEKRSNTPASVLKNIPPIYSEDIPRSKQTILNTPQYATPYGYGDPRTPPIPE